MKTVLSILLTCFSTALFAQAPTAEKNKTWKFAALAQGGLIGGASDGDYTAMVIPGVQKGPWMLGIGAGIDNYVQPGIPVVAYGAYQYGSRKAKPFAYAQAGPHFPWAKNEWDDTFMNDQKIYDLHTGWLAEGGLGYSFSFIGKTRLQTSLGFSIKQVKYEELQWSWWIMPWPMPDGPTDTYHQKLTMSRVVLKVGVRF